MHTFRKLILLEQTLFGLPWAFLGALMPYLSAPATARSSAAVWIWMTVAFSGARTAGMCFNRLTDREIDAANPRTQHRPLQIGEVTPRQVLVTALAALSLFFYSCWRLGSICQVLAPVVVLLIFTYAYTKRVTSLCHFVLGLVEFFVPVMATAAITHTVTPTALLLGFALFCWISGMDIIYATQDVCFDRQWRLQMPRAPRRTALSGLPRTPFRPEARRPGG